ncbi:hypothetical protein F5Y12DRAFT_585719 [Xylaria sp. FL1777]|nr:hypothetical protein F5Y12DRAFT_585719 [Xylaria sp. FL1777]
MSSFIVNSHPSQSFDRSTGQTFLQWDVPAPRSMPVPWNRVTKPVVHTYSRPRSRHFGAAPLVDMCSKVVAAHIEELDRSHLQDLPVQLVGRIWEYVEQTTGLSVESWKLLASILVPGVTNKEGMERCINPFLINYSIEVPKTQPLAAYIEPLLSDPLDFLTHLTIAGRVHGGTAELLQLVRLKNLAVLEIFQPDNEADTWTFPRLTDSVVREWSTTPEAFPFLRILRVWGEDNTTRHSLRYIDAFPSLVVYDVAGRRRDWEDKGNLEEKDDGEEEIDFVWKSTLGTWSRDLQSTLLIHFILLKATQELKPHLVTNVGPAVNWKAHEVPKIRLISCQRGKPGVHDVSSECDTTPNLHHIFRAWCHSGDEYSPFYGHSYYLDSGSLWGFLMYCFIGTLLSNRDLSAQGLEIGERALGLGNIVLPPRPMINLILGGTTSDNTRHPSRYVSKSTRKYFETQLTFIRHGSREGKREASSSTTVASKAVKHSLNATSPGAHIPLKKRRNISSILESFSVG